MFRGLFLYGFGIVTTCLLSETMRAKLTWLPFLPTNLEIILLTKNYDLFAGKSSKFRHKEISGFRS